MKYSPTTLPKLLYNGLKKYPDERFSVTKRDGGWIKTSLGEFQEMVRHFAMGLYELGVRPGDKVSIHSENSSEWLICDLAILSIGAANVPIYSTQPGDQIKYILENSESKVHIVSDDEMFAETKSLIKEIESVKAVIILTPSKHKKLKQFEDVIQSGKEYEKKYPDLFEELKNSVDPEDLATLIY
ncbi:AMP-binding protein, partial [Rhodohalobacter halophilus]|uniref:AMP-binding protein n=1 Tax=Rhodohalobacter halophilus TaxID=1812810 RepID=UPI00114D100D